MMLPPDVLTIAFVPTAAVVVGAIVNWHEARHARMAAQHAQGLASSAAKEAEASARALITATQNSNAKLDQIVETSNNTHVIVNNQRTIMLNLISDLRTRIASDNPNDQQAQAAAINAIENLAERL